jgi:hypothetical protein
MVRAADRAAGGMTDRDTPIVDRLAGVIRELKDES